MSISCETDLGALMTAGNHEAKAIVLGSMQPDKAYGEWELHTKLFLSPQGIDPVYEGSIGNQLGYCSESLEPAGCVSRVAGSSERYRLTDMGESEGKAYIGHVLELSLGAGEIGLRSLYGMARTSNGKTSRPPLDRLRIFRQLLETDDIQISEIKDSVGLSQSAAARSLKWLENGGIIDYESMAPQDISDSLTYTFPGNLQLPPNRAAVRQMIYDTLDALNSNGSREHTLTEVMDTLQARYPDEAFDQQSRRTYTIGVMNKLVKAEVIAKNMNGRSRRSGISLTEEARPIVERSVAIAEGMLAGDADFIEEGREQLRIILGDEEKVRTLIAKAFRASPEANGLPFAERYAHVTAYLGEQAGTTSEITEQVMPHGMTEASTRNTLEVMRNRGQAISRRVEGTSEHQWELVPVPLPQYR